MEQPWMRGGGECGALMRGTDWSRTALGAPDTWPSELKTTVSLLLHARHPMFLWWGEELVQLYNDACLPSLRSGKHPRAMGQRGQECWPELWHLLSPQLDAVMSRGVSTWNEHQLVPILRNDQMQDIYWTYGFSPVMDEQGAVRGALGLWTETTERATREAVKVAEAEREKLLVELENANRTKDEFLAMLGHELRNPLAPISTALHIMKLRAPNEGARERQVIERQVQHMVRLVDDLLDVARITGGKIELKKRIVEMSEIVSRAIELASPLLEQKAQSLSLDVAAVGLPLEADELRLAQVVSNLLTNASKYSDDGSIITITARRDSGRVLLSVKDVGIGISNEMLPRIFESFSQERQSLARSQGGLGLGLAIVKSFVGMHGGTVEAASAGRGEGSEFILSFPLSSRDADQTHAPTLISGKRPLRSAAPRGLRSILVVDDNVDAADMLQDSLTLLGYSVRVAYDGPNAIKAMESFTPDIALLDIGLPVMDGYELARRLKAIPALTNTRLVAITGYGQDSDRLRTAAAGFANHIVKPVDLDKLEVALIAWSSEKPAPLS